MLEQTPRSDAMNSQERIGKLFLLFLYHPRGLSFSAVRSFLSEAYRGDEEANRKKFQRDRDSLKKLGLHLELDQSGAAANESDRVYVPAATSRTLMRDLRLSDVQKSYLMGLILRGMKGDDEDLCRSLYLKLFYNQTDLRPEPGGIERQTDPLYPGDRPVPEWILEALQNAMMDRRKIEFNYESVSGETKRRRIHPLALNLYRRMWYLTAYCELVSDYRLFQLDRITEPVILNETIDAHPPEVVQYLKPHPLNLRRESLKAIHLRLTPDQLDHFDHFIRELPPGQRIKTGKNMRDIVTGNPGALFFWMFRHPHAVTAIGPEIMRDRFTSFLKSIEDRNAETGVST